MGPWTALKEALVGRRDAAPSSLLEAWPELRELRLRRGGLPVRLGGWCLGRSTVAGITLGKTVWLAPRVRWDVGLLLHELRHTQQFESERFFPLRYLWASLTRGYTRNPYELDAVAYAGKRLHDAILADASSHDSPSQEGAKWSSIRPRPS